MSNREKSAKVISIDRFFIQRLVGHILMLPMAYLLVFLMHVVMRFRIENREKIRRQFREIVKEKGPLLICSNHLTYMDSAIIIWALAPNPWYFFHYKYFSWNLPADDFFGKKLKYRIFGYLNKCIFIDRDGSAKHHTEILSVCRTLVEEGEIVTIFPEGKRSRTGKFEPDKLTHGTGKIVYDIDGCRVLSVYVRSFGQKSYSNYPKKGARFYISMELLRPKTKFSGRKGYSDIVSKIGKSIKRQEREYFRVNG